MDLRNLTSTPNQLDIQRRPSSSSLSSASGYASSGYGGGNNGAANGVNGRQQNKLHYNEYNSNPPPPQNVWINNNNSSALNDVTPWVEQQKQQQSKVGNLDLEKDKKNGLANRGAGGSASPSIIASPTAATNGAKSGERPSPQHQGMNSGSKAAAGGHGDADHGHGQNQNDSDDLDDHDDDLIPTAIVIKNIPFAIKKEQLLDVMTKLSLPLPYAFNYHFDNGVFRGLAFANFTSTDETSAVVNQLNGREIGGRKLRVEYKKMLPAQERERIEREKREKRGQLEEQHRSTSNASLASLISGTSTTAATKNLSVNGANAQPERLFLGFPTAASSTIGSSVPSDINFNDIEVLELYTQLVTFKDENSKSIVELAFPPHLNLAQRKVLSGLCNFLNLMELYDNGLIIIRRKPGQLFQVLTPNPGASGVAVANGGAAVAISPAVAATGGATGLASVPGSASGVPPAELSGTGSNSPHPSNSMMNLNQMNQQLHTPTHGHPELLRSHSQSALPLPRLRQQSSTPIQPQFPQFSGNVANANGPKALYQGIQSFGFLPGNHGNNLLPNQLGSGPFNASSSAAAILRNNTGGSRPPYGDIRSTPPLANSFPTPHSVTESPTPTPQHAHSNLFDGNVAGDSTVNGSAGSVASGSGSASAVDGLGAQDGSGSKPSSQPSTPLQTGDINSRFAPFGQHAQLTSSLSSLSNAGTVPPSSRHSEDFGDMTGKFNTINLNYDTAPPTTGSGIWGPK